MSREEVSGSKLGITMVVMIAALMALIDITIVNVALNDIRASFATPIDQIGWVSTGYMMANIVVIPMTGWFQRRFGYRRYFAGSIILFTVARALFGLGAVTGPLLGPTIGGYLIEWFNWHWVFLVNVPLGVTVAIMCARVVEEPGFKPAKSPIDS